MKYFKLFLSAVLAVSLACVPAFAMNHNHSGHDHGPAQSSTPQGHVGLAVKGDLLDLGSKSAKGIMGMAHLKDVRASMAKLGMKTTHHFMIYFHDEQTGKPIEIGTVALKINDPDGVSTGPIELVGMQGHFGGDVVLDKPGEYHFILAGSLNGGENRQYHYHAVIK